MTIDKTSNDKSLDRALVQCLRIFAKHGRKIRHERLASKEGPLDSEKIEKEAKNSDNRESVQVHGTTAINVV